MDHLRYAGRPFDEQRAAFLDIIRADHIVHQALVRARAIDLPDWLVVSGALYNAVWNRLTRKPCGFGTKDIDLFYFDETDTPTKQRMPSSPRQKRILPACRCRSR